MDKAGYSRTIPTMLSSDSVDENTPTVQKTAKRVEMFGG